MQESIRTSVEKPPTAGNPQHYSTVLVSNNTMDFDFAKGHPLVGKPLMFWADKKGNYRFYVSIRKAEKCLFSRRCGHRGMIVRGYSMRLRLFGKDIL